MSEVQVETKEERRARKLMKREEKEQKRAAISVPTPERTPEPSKKKRRNKTLDNETTIDDAGANILSEKNSKKKRKRDHDADSEELEIDLSLPEPPSKKALRRAKKGKAPLPDSTNGENEARIKSTNTSHLDDLEEEKQKAAPKPVKRSEFGIWIGNLNWEMTSDGLRDFFTSKSDIKDDDITRIHMPKPKEAAAARLRIKPQNSGYAYVDFSTEACLNEAIALSETDVNGRKVLIKNANSFEGRPDKSKDGKTNAANTKPPSKRVFIGNLGFDVTKDDVFSLYAPCGDVEDVFLATFQDTGKCKGFGWVTFADVEAATLAVQGFVMKEPEDDIDDEEIKMVAEDGSEAVKQKRKPKKGRKWFVNQINGRILKCEFAEDKQTRYKKRYGKDKPKEDSSHQED